MLNNILKLKGREIDISDIEHYKRFSVFLPLINHQENHHVLFEVRSDHLNKQPSEICFPGGKIEKGETKVEAAIRETCEELNIIQGDIEIVTQLDTVVTPFNTIIYPFAGFINHYKNTFSPDEVKETFLVPLSFFMDNKPLYYKTNVQISVEEDFPFALIPKGKNYPWAKGTYPTYFYEYDGKIIWGITARIVYNFIQCIKV